MMRRRRARSAVAIAAGAAILATVPLFIHHAPAPRDVRARVVRAAAAWSAAAPPQLARYNDPFTPGCLRTNEVWYVVDQASLPEAAKQ